MTFTLVDLIDTKLLLWDEIIPGCGYDFYITAYIVFRINVDRSFDESFHVLFQAFELWTTAVLLASLSGLVASILESDILIASVDFSELCFEPLTEKAVHELTCFFFNHTFGEGENKL